MSKNIYENLKPVLLQDADRAVKNGGIASGITSAEIAHMEQIKQAEMDRMMRGRYEGRLVDAMDDLSSNIHRLCHLLETLQLGVVGSKRD